MTPSLGVHLHLSLAHHPSSRVIEELAVCPYCISPYRSFQHPTRCSPAPTNQLLVRAYRSSRGGIHSIPTPNLPISPRVFNMAGTFEVSQLPLSAWAGVAFMVWSFYVSVMLIYRCIFERPVVVGVPPFKGWTAHTAAVNRVNKQFRAYLNNRTAGQRVSLQRSKGGVVESNRTLDATYKRETLRVDVSDFDSIIDLEFQANGHALLHIEPSVPQDFIARVALAHGLMPPVVLEFPGITAGTCMCLV